MRRNSMRRNPPARRGPAVVVVIPPWLLAVAVTVVVGLVAGLAGCTGSAPGPAPTSLHPGTAATPTTSTPTGDPTDAAYASAIAAVEGMYAEFNLALRSGRTADYRATYVKSCGFCQQNALLIDSATKRKQTIVGGQISLGRMQKAAIHGSDVFVQGFPSQAAARIVAVGKTVRRFRAAPAFLAVWTVRRIDGKWIVIDEDVPR